MLSADNHRSIVCPHCGKIAATVSVIVTAHDAEPPCAEQIGDAFKMPIDVHPWSGRLRNAFQNWQRYDDNDGRYIDEPIRTFADLCSITEPELHRYPNIGKVSIAEIKTALAKYGLKLRQYA
jgi:hypothetical protein